MLGRTMDASRVHWLKRICVFISRDYDWWARKMICFCLCYVFTLLVKFRSEIWYEKLLDAEFIIFQIGNGFQRNCFAYLILMLIWHNCIVKLLDISSKPLIYRNSRNHNFWLQFDHVKIWDPSVFTKVAHVYVYTDLWDNEWKWFQQLDIVIVSI